MRSRSSEASPELTAPVSPGGLLESVRAASAEVARRARFVRLAAEGVSALAERLIGETAPAPVYDLAHHHRGSRASTLAYVVTLDAVNFGSGWFPHLRKRPGLSGYFTLATALKERFDAQGPFSAEALSRLGRDDCARIFGQEPGDAELGDLFEGQARALRELGQYLARRFDGRFEALVGAAEGSAERLVALLVEMPCYRDLARYGDLEVPFLKRAQITAADLALAFEGRGPGRFRDLRRLTCFADNLVPHVLRMEGALVYAPELLERIRREEPLASGAPEEVEIRALAVHAVERLVGEMNLRGAATTAQEVDHRLWYRGQRPEIKAEPRHRARCLYY